MSLKLGVLGLELIVILLQLLRDPLSIGLFHL